MTREAQSHADEDKKDREKIEARNRLDSLVYNTEKILKENREKIGEADAVSVESALSRAKSVLESSATEASELNSAFEELTKSSHHLAEMMYQKTAQTPPSGEGHGAGAGARGAGKKKEDEVIDAEYVDMDENKS